MTVDLQNFLYLAHDLFKKHEWTLIFNSSADLVLKKEFPTSIVRSVHQLFFIDANHLEEKDIIEIIQQIHNSPTGQPPLLSMVNQLIFVFENASDHIISWLEKNGKEQKISTSISTISWIVDLNHKKLYTHQGPPFVNKGKEEISHIIQQL